MNPIASATLPTQSREATLAGIPVKPATPVAGAAPAETAGTAPVMLPQAPAPVAAGGTAAPVPQRALAEDPREPRPPLSGDGPPETSSRLPETGARPVPPLRSFAQIPTRMMEEITRLREEAAESASRGVPGRPDPTPLPASPQAIGAQAMAAQPTGAQT